MIDLASSAPSHLSSHVQRKQSITPVEGQGFPQVGQDAGLQNRPSFSDASSLSVETPSPGSGAGHRRSIPTRGGMGPGPDGVWTPFDSQKNNLTHGLDFGGSGERLGLGFLLDPSQQVTKLKDIQRSPESYGSHYPGQQISNFAEAPMVAHAAPVRNIPPTCPLDGILLDFLHSRQRELAEGTPTQRLVGPAYPSVSSLLNPEKSIYSHPLSKDAREL